MYLDLISTHQYNNANRIYSLRKEANLFSMYRIESNILYMGKRING